MDRDMKFTGISIEEHRNIGGGRIETYFTMPAGKESLAASDILLCLAEGHEIMLSNDLDDGEGYEGCTFIRRSSSGGLEMKTGGHGWSSDWKPANEVEVTTTVKELAHRNRHGGRGNRGSFTSPQKS
jgi:hypothetical protein